MGSGAWVRKVLGQEVRSKYGIGREAGEASNCFP